MPSIAANSLPVASNWPQPEGVPSRCAAKSTQCAEVAKEPAKEAKSAVVEDSAITPQQSALESMMVTLRRALQAVSNLGRSLDQVGSAAAVGAQAVSKQRTGIEIRTQEGDVVRIHYSTRTEVNVGAVHASGTDGSVSASEASVSQRERLRVQVSGDLNADELQAINAVLAKVDSLAKEFFAGDFDKAFAQAAEFNFDSEQLADVAIRLSQRQRVSVVATSISPLASLPTASPTQGSEPIAAAVEPAVNAPEGASATVEPTLQPTASAPLPAPDAAVTNTIATSIANYVAKLTTHLRVTDNDVRLGMTFHSKLDMLLASIKAHKPDVAPPVDAAVNKLQDVAGKAAVLV